MSAQSSGVKGCTKAGRNPNPDGAYTTKRHKAVHLRHQIKLAARNYTSKRALARFTAFRLNYQVAAEHIYPLK